MTAGYLSPAYASALELGVPRALPLCGGWILQRNIAGTSDHDGMGCYPLFCCEDWSRLNGDLDDLNRDLVALSLVTDPFGNYDIRVLNTCFPDLVRPFKNHFVVDLMQRPEEVWNAHHKRNERRGLANVDVQMVDDVEACADTWVALYSALTERHNIKGFAAFSARSLTLQLSVPGTTVFRAMRHHTTVGMTVWYVQERIAYYHLAAYTKEGYELRASFALFAFAIRYFAGAGIQWLNLGAAAGLEDDPADGLARFKRGWSTGTRPTYLCGRVFDHDAYSSLREMVGASTTGYFPAYRSNPSV